MKAIILSAGQGRRMLPLTRRTPKCLLEVDGSRSALEVQLRTLAACGVRHATVMVGFGAERVERALARMAPAGLEVVARFNPLSARADNLFTAWLARTAMDDDFLLLNGDTLFERGVVERLLGADPEPVRLAVARKAAYDDDDMKVVLDPSGRVRAIGKKLEGREPDAEAIGMSLFRGPGVAAFRRVLEEAVRHPEALDRWYTSVLDELAAQAPVHAVDIEAHWWAEIDSPADLEAVRSHYRRRSAAGLGAGAARTDARERLGS